MSSYKIYLKIPIGVIYYVCDPRTPRRNLYLMEHADYFCDRLWKMLIAKMPEIEPLGGLRLYIHRQYSLPPRSWKNHKIKYHIDHDSLTEEKRKEIGMYIGEIIAEKEEFGTTEGLPMFFFRCPHPDQAGLGFNIKKAVKKGEYYGETAFVWGEPWDMDTQEERKSEELDQLIRVLCRNILNIWNSEDVGITTTNSLKYPGSDNPTLRFENFKKAVWKGEAFILKLNYLNPNKQDFGCREVDEYCFEKIRDSEGKQFTLDKNSIGAEIPIEAYSPDEFTEKGWASFISRVSYCDDWGFTNALFRIAFLDLIHDNPLIRINGQNLNRSGLFSFFFPKIEDQNKAIDYYLELENKEREEYSNYCSHLVERIKSCDNTQKTEKEKSNKVNKAKKEKETKQNFKSLHFFNEILFSTDDRKHELMETLQPIIEQVKEKQDWYAVLRGAQSVKEGKDKFGKKLKVLADRVSDVAMFDDLCMLMPELAENVNIFPINDTKAEATPSSKYKTLRKALSEERGRWTIKEKGELFVQDWKKTEYIPSKNEVLKGKRIDNNNDTKYSRMLQIGQNIMAALEQLRDKYIQS